MFGLSRGTIIVDCGSRIQNSYIDMNGKVITNHGTPINSQDVANKEYVDTFIGGGGIPVVAINLTATNYTQALNFTSGTFIILVKNNIFGGPSGIFMASKSEDFMESNITRLSSSAGNITNEKLRLKWDPNSFIQLRKTGNNYDGQYIIKYIYV